MTGLDVLAVTGETVSWIAFVAGILLLLGSGLARLLDGTWDPTEVAVVERQDGAVVRWFADGDFHEREIDPDEHPRHGEEGELVGWVRRRTPDRLRFTATPRLPKALGTLAAILLVIGVAASVTSTVAEVSARPGTDRYSSAANFSMSVSVPDTMMRSWVVTTVRSVA
ncbi:hypothetical protein [Agromyces sp. SYSU T0242]|uniref:hypothetical protein n=1 Tax=Agromyces litoreus TaxID=3158561 RepID=UPI0033999A9B